MKLIEQEVWNVTLTRLANQVQNCFILPYVHSCHSVAAKILSNTKTLQVVVKEAYCSILSPLPQDATSAIR